MNTMENFLSWDILLTFSGCVAGTVFLTEWLKKIFVKLPAQLVSFIIAGLILVVGHIATGTFVWAEVPLYLMNAVAVSLSANGGFDLLKKAFGKTEPMAEELYLSKTGNENETYLALSREPDQYKDGELVTFRVKKIDSEDSQK